MQGLSLCPCTQCHIIFILCLKRNGIFRHALWVNSMNNQDNTLHKMLDEQIVAGGIHNPRVLEAMEYVPRHIFVPEEKQDEAYADHPIILPEEMATISQPYMVAYMTDALQCNPSDRVLEIGTGSGYQSAILSYLCKEVYTIERHFSLNMSAMRTLQVLGRHNVHFQTGETMAEWKDKAPFDKILVTAATYEVPSVLLDQLKEDGQMIIPLGDSQIQTLTKIQKKKEGYTSFALIPCVFVPLIIQRRKLTENDESADSSQE
ncbi:protein-L-isoaspartate(D-aspartate) O-methyltransferase [bacterium]|nr:protein-L-isoaspartate(D-aspartate) O-methyltransferase [bacterium]